MLAVLSGTARPGSPALAVSNVLVDMFRAQNETARCIDLSVLPEDALGPASWSRRHPAFVPEERALVAARGLVVVVEERLGGMPGELKLFLDLVRYPEVFVHLPVAVVGLSDGELGTLRAVEQAELCLHHMGAHLYGTRIAVHRIGSVVDATGDIPDPTRRARFLSLARGFVGFVDALRRKPLHTEEAIPTVIAAPPSH